MIETAKLKIPPRGGGILNIVIDNKTTLYAVFMPFVKNGALYVATQRTYVLGDEVFMVLSLMGEQEKIAVTGKVVWITPKGAANNRHPGIGVQFRDSGSLRTKIETYLAGTQKSERPTETL